MSLYTVFKEKMYEAIKARNPLRTGAFRLLLGEIELIQSRNGVALPDEKIIALAKKFVKDNEETMKFTSEPEALEKLVGENKVFNEFIPSVLSKEDTFVLMDNNLYLTIKEAPNDGVATGLAMKFFKSKDLSVDGNIVRQFVSDFRIRDLV